MSLSTFSADLVIDVIRTNASHVALFTANPVVAGDLNDEQANTNGYSRQSITWTDTGDDDDENSATITFTASGGTWTGPWYVGLMDSGTHGAGNVIAVSSSTTTTTSVADGNSIEWDAADIEVTATLSS